MTKTLNIPGVSRPPEIDTDYFEENEIKEMGKSLYKFWLGQLLCLLRKSEEISFDGYCVLEHKLRTEMFDGNSTKAFQNY